MAFQCAWKSWAKSASRIRNNQEPIVGEISVLFAWCNSHLEGLCQLNSSVRSSSYAATMKPNFMAR